MITTTTAAIRVRGIEKGYGDLPVLRGVDFDVAPGSVFALLGANGAGKTTLVRILSTLLRPDAGSATVHGYEVAAEPQRVRESISLTGQFAAVDEILTAGRTSCSWRGCGTRATPAPSPTISWNGSA
ncbi:hypothetical protein GCM10009648_39670 [Tsukamurella spumae]